MTVLGESLSSNTLGERVGRAVGENVGEFGGKRSLVALPENTFVKLYTYWVPLRVELQSTSV